MLDIANDGLRMLWQDKKDKEKSQLKRLNEHNQLISNWK
jgi:hypothetical protein